MYFSVCALPEALRLVSNSTSGCIRSLSRCRATRCTTPPQLDSNYFFYDGLYWVYAQDSWYSSPWYNGPWDTVAPEIVPLFVLRVPVRYYRQPPAYFRTWNPEGSPRWGEHWGHEWEQPRNGWDHWDRAAAPVRAPLPDYQRSYSGDRYPRADQQLTLRNENYSYHPGDAPARARPPYQQPSGQGAVAQRRMPPEGRPRGNPTPGNADSTNASTTPAGDVVSTRRDSPTSPTGRRTDVMQPPAAERAGSAQTRTRGAEHKDNRAEQEQSQSRQSQPGPPMTRPSQSRQPPPQPAHSPDTNERASPNITAADPKRDPGRDH